MNIIFYGPLKNGWMLYQEVLFVNLVLSIIIIFFQRRDPKAVWAWLLLLWFIPVIGFLCYLLAGTDTHKRKLFRNKGYEDTLKHASRGQKEGVENHTMEYRHPNIAGYSDLVMYHLDTSDAILTQNNDIRIFTDGPAKFSALLDDIRAAQKYILIQYYIIRKDFLFEDIVNVLRQKVAEGVEVRVLYDGMGSRTVPDSYWRKLRGYGIHIAEFFPPVLGRLQLRVNYRNHRKIAVIDGKIGYVGGYNIGREYVDRDARFGTWRDTHLRMTGGSVSALAMRFIMDWNYAARDNLFENELYRPVTHAESTQHCDVQIVSSGPDSKLEEIRDTYLRLISGAKEKIYIQTPYFIPDEAIMTALIMAAHSGVEVNLMIPCKPDHLFVYWATYSYFGDLIMAGANCYTYNDGFLHAKGVIADEEVFSYGTANMDIRSFSLNFEVNAIVYNAAMARKMADIFREDIRHSTRVTKKMYMSRSLWTRIREQISRLLSPLL
jgi:cardiolipin synthase